MADQVFDPSKPFTVVEPPAAATPVFDPSKPFEEVQPAGGAMNFAIVNGVRVPLEEPEPGKPETAWRHAATIGAPSIGDRYVDKPLTTRSVLDVVRGLVFGANAERPRSVQQQDLFGTQAFAEGKGPMPILPLPEAEIGPFNFSTFTKNLTANRRHKVGLDLLSDALNIKKAGQITEPEYHTALARLYSSHTPDNPIQFSDEIAQRLRQTSHDMDEHVKGIADQFPRATIPTEPLRDIATAGASNPIGGGGPGSTFVQQGRGTVLKLYPQLGHYEPVLDAQGKRVGTRLVSDPVSIPDAATILKSVNKQLNDRLGPQAARRVRTDMLATDPTYAALDALATSLRRGIDEGLEAQGVPGVRAFRQDQAAVIKLQQVAEKVEGKGHQKITRTRPVSSGRQLAADLAPSIGTMAGAEAAGPAGALAGKTMGEAVRNRLTPSMTRDAAVAKAYRLMKPAPNLSFPMMPAHTPGAGAAQAAGAARPGPGGAGPTGQAGGPQAPPGASSAGGPGAGPTGGGWRPGAGQPPPRRPGETWEQWGRRNGVPPSWWNQGGKPGEPWGPQPQTGPWGTTGGVGELRAAPPPEPPPGAPVDVFEGTVAPGETTGGLPKAPGFIVDTKGKVRRPGKAALIPDDVVWPRPAMAEGYRAPKNDPSFVRAVKGTYAEVFKRAETSTRPADRPLPAPAPAGAQRGGSVAPSAPRGDAPRVHFREARAEAARLREETLDTLTARYVEAGHPDPPAQIRAKLLEDLQGIEDLHHEAAVDEEGGRALLKAIADSGGISINAETAQKGEIAWLKEFRDGDELAGVRGVFRDLSRHSADAKRMNMQRQMMKSGRKVPYGGLTLDGALEAIKQEGRFPNIKTIEDLTAAIQKAARTGTESAAERKARALADLVYHSERDIAGRGAAIAEDEAGFEAFAAAVEELSAAEAGNKPHADAAQEALATIRQHGFDVELYNDETGWVAEPNEISDRYRGSGKKTRAMPKEVKAAIEALNKIPYDVVDTIISK